MEKMIKLKGGTKKTRRLMEEFIEKIGFEQKLREIVLESMWFDLDYENTPTYKKLLKQVKKRYNREVYKK